MQATPSDPQQEATAKDCVQRLKHLKTLYDNELITQEDFETRKSQIVDELTRTTGTSTYVIISSYFLYQYPSFYTYLLLNISISFWLWIALWVYESLYMLTVHEPLQWGSWSLTR